MYGVKIRVVEEWKWIGETKRGGEEWGRKQPLASYIPLNRLSLAARSYH